MLPSLLWGRVMHQQVGDREGVVPGCAYCCCCSVPPTPQRVLSGVFGDVTWQR